MYQNNLQKPENTPALQILYLFLFAIVGLIVFAVIGLGIVFVTQGMAGVRAAALSDYSYISAFKILLVAQQIGLFLTPAILLAIVEGKKPSNFYGLKVPKADLLALVTVLSICWMPIMGLSNELNQKMVFPGFLKGLESWMRAMEDNATKATEAILQMKSISMLLVNLFVIAVVPAICEEFIFRGAIQRVIFRLKSNPHIAIWLSAFIFSAIHFQFFGFIPRLLLGAAFGYIYFWTGSIWYAVFAHFLNNGYAVVVAFYLQANNKSISSVDEMTVPWYGYIISAILTLVLFKFLKERSRKTELNSSEDLS